MRICQKPPPSFPRTAAPLPLLGDGQLLWFALPWTPAQTPPRGGGTVSAPLGTLDSTQ